MRNVNYREGEYFIRTKIDGSSTMALFDIWFVECLFYGLINFLGTN